MSRITPSIACMVSSCRAGVTGQVIRGVPSFSDGVMDMRAPNLHAFTLGDDTRVDVELPPVAFQPRLIGRIVHVRLRFRLEVDKIDGPRRLAFHQIDSAGQNVVVHDDRHIDFGPLDSIPPPPHPLPFTHPVNFAPVSFNVWFPSRA